MCVFITRLKIYYLRTYDLYIVHRFRCVLLIILFMCSRCIQRAVDRGRREPREETPAQETENDARRTTVAAVDP